MIYRKIILYLMLLSIFCSYSGALCGKIYGGSWEDTAIYGIETSDNGYLIVGTTKSWSVSRTDRIHANDTKQDIYVIKTDSEGNELWSRIIGQGGDDIKSKQYNISQYYRGTSAIETADGFFIAGYIAGGDGLLYKLGPDGSLKWNKTYPSTFFGRGGIIRSNDGDYIIPGYVSGDICLTKIENEGDVIWNNIYPKSRIEYVRDIEKSSDGGYIIGGYDYQWNDEDFLLLKVDSDGNEEWYRTYGVKGVWNRDRAWGVTEAYDNGYIIVGRTDSFDPENRTDYFIIKTDPDGIEVWNKTSAEPKSYLLADIIKDNGNYIITGYYHPVPEPYTGLIMAIDHDGNEIWSKSVKDSEEIWSLKNTSDGKYLLVGVSLSFTTSYEAYFTLIDSTGDCNLETACYATSNTYYYDKDMDGHGSYSEGSYLEGNMTATNMCVSVDGYSLDDTDCDGILKTINPEAVEICGNGIDEDCDGKDLLCTICLSGADKDDSGEVSMDELIAFIEDWKTGSISINQVLDAISEWKSGC